MPRYVPYERKLISGSLSRHALWAQSALSLLAHHLQTRRCTSLTAKQQTDYIGRAKAAMAVLEPMVHELDSLCRRERDAFNLQLAKEREAERAEQEPDDDIAF